MEKVEKKMVFTKEILKIKWTRVFLIGDLKNIGKVN